MTDSATHTTNITPEMKAALGTELGRRVSYPITDSDIRRWALAVYWPDLPPARYLAGNDSALVAPEEFNPFAWAVSETILHPSGVDADRNDPDRTEKQLGVTGPGLKYMLNGGMETEYGASMRAGDVITSVTTLASYSERPGRLGLMLLSVTEDTWTNQHEEIVKRGRTTLIRY
ncbi:FAS1-like dehydratase domain-containing protein [Pseudonocardia oroxyli]|uniref:N-terminal half of MaoC dehydratase n=1 Tax=Pseudonocardia oroxyli TaxID=366584 RepID=A0A1G8EL77_PSEOR|nr:MaoC family dehydratase N-terminal domain-containing protein [Pseudonocardia oroxyli]SDH70648.1 N-terminal half of MaoC dehydratase [Pseudonocardia oroxyli]